MAKHGTLFVIIVIAVAISAFIWPNIDITKWGKPKQANFVRSYYYI